jgi:hypothetical protein
MSFTNIDLVKKHIGEQELGSVSKKNAACQLTGETYFQLPHIMLQTDSEKVKAKEQNVPIQETVSFSSSDTMLLSHQELIPDTVVVANDSSLGEIYAENIDYTIDYENGKITRIPSGAIPAAVSVVIWYFYYRVYSKDIDYQIDYAKGQIRRISSGEIEDGQWVLVDYTVEYSLINDEVIENAIKEANDQILQYIDATYSNSTDQALVTAETYLAVSILTNIKAMEAINQPVGTGSFGQAHSISLAWAKMSGVYQGQAYEMLKQFRKDPGAFCSPYAVRSIR